jgi:hypothetical protein
MRQKLNWKRVVLGLALLGLGTWGLWELVPFLLDERIEESELLPKRVLRQGNDREMQDARWVLHGRACVGPKSRICLQEPDKGMGAHGVFIGHARCPTD